MIRKNRLLKTVNIEDSLHSQLRIEAFRKKLSLQDLLQTVIKKHLSE